MLAHFVRSGLLVLAIAGGVVVLKAAPNLTSDQMKLLRDPAGWDYVKMSDTGMRTDHPCFDGSPPSDACSGRLVLGADNRFIQEVRIHGQTVARHGTYTLDGDQLTFVDELLTKDGPYTVQFDTDANLLVIEMQQVRIELRAHKTMPTPNKKDAGTTIFTADQLKLLRDPAGWDYVKVMANGVQTDYPCFDGAPPSVECRQRMILRIDSQFRQFVTMDGETAPKRGTYTLESDQLTFFDEMETIDGPYTLEIDTPNKALVMRTTSLRIEMALHRVPQRRNRRDAK